ncbi:MAG TPA: DUF1223 domain-containing protein [Bryobacteraceae bacterium]|nr:DUF1223 domain-containing protein [Bryobacteraceae bacterium]
MAQGSKFIVVFLLFTASATILFSASETRAPILVELFTSEGCSSCPPADRLLEQLDSRFVVLSEHVDYWNHDGWTDPFSSAEWTARQETYGRHFKLDGPYTPQMVVDGSVEFTGSNVTRAAHELALAKDRPKAAVRLERSSTGVQVKIESARTGAGVFLAIADDSGESQVGAGENRGRQLHHVAIARSLRKIGRIDSEGRFHREVALPEKTRRQRVIVFLQQGDAGVVSGAAMLAAEKL